MNTSKKKIRDRNYRKVANRNFNTEEPILETRLSLAELTNRMEKQERAITHEDRLIEMIQPEQQRKERLNKSMASRICRGT